MEPLISIRDLQVSFPVGKAGILGRPKAYLQAVAGVSLNIRKGETLGLVGESGSGKTTFGRAILRLQEPTGGDVVFNLDDQHIPYPSQLTCRSAYLHVREHPNNT